MDVIKVDLKSILDSCRTCMTKNICMIGLFDNSCNNIIEEITFCTGVTLTQDINLPKKICIQCLKSLSIAHKFKTSCLLAEKTFQKLLDDNVKCEPIEINDVEFDNDVEFKNELDDDYFDDKINNELELPDVNKLKQRVTTKARRTKPITTTKCATITNKSIKPIRLKKYKFKKLHCELCDTKFDNKEDYTQHKKEFHKDNERWVCEICGKLFVHRASHYTHIRSHMPPKYSCHQCDYRTSHKYDLVKHIRTHTGVKMYQCEYCTASYYTSSNLTGHIRRLHIKERPFSCNLCDLSFFDRTKLNRHIDTHNEIKRFTCDLCHACFTRRCHWKKHLLKQHNIITPPQRPGRQKTNAIVGEYLVDNKINKYTEPVTKVTTDSESNKSNSYTKRKELHQKGNIISEHLIQNKDVISANLIQKRNVISEHLMQKGDNISEDLIQKGNVISEDLTQKDIKIKFATVAEFLILKNDKEL